MACNTAIIDSDIFKIPKDDLEYQKLSNFTHLTIAKDDSRDLCRATRAEIKSNFSECYYFNL